MAFVVDKETCTNCGICEAQCPAHAIFEDGDVMYIDPNLCIDCGACQPVCPVEAIHPE